MARSRVGTLVVVDETGRLRGLLTERDLRFVNGGGLRVADRMTPLERLVVAQGPLAAEDAERIMVERKIKKLPLVDPDGTLLGLVTAKDLIKQRRLPFATRDEQGRLRVGAAIGATGDYLERAAELIKAGVDVLVIDIAHGHSVVMDRAIGEVRKRFRDVELIAGNVAHRRRHPLLLERGVNGIKVGHRPWRRLHDAHDDELRRAAGAGAGRLPDRRGRFQRAAHCRRRHQAPRRHRAGPDTRRRLRHAGSAFAGTEETPGEVVHKSVLLPESQKTVKVPFKVLRGMASLEAIRDRLDVEDADPVELDAIGAEGMEISVPARGSARTIVRDMIKHLCSSISYGGAASLRELREKFWADPGTYLIKLSSCIRRRSPAHDR